MCRTFDRGRGAASAKTGDFQDPSNEELRLAVADELRWDPRIDGGMIAVSVDGGTVILSGTIGPFRQKRREEAENVTVNSVNGIVTLTGRVRSWAERDAAAAAAWAAEGVLDVHDQLSVVY